MNYKALEDLVNILVRKCGTELSADVSEKEISILENRLKKVRNDIEELKSYISKKDYKINSKYETDNQKRNIIESELNTLKTKREELMLEIKEYTKLEEDGISRIDSLIKEKEALEEYANCLNRDRNYFLLEKSNKYDEYNSKYVEVKNNLNNEINEINKYELLIEQLREIDANISNLTNDYNNIKDDSEYSDNNDKVKDLLVLEELEHEEKLISEKIDKWNTNPELIGSRILAEYKKGTLIDDVLPAIDELIDKATTEYKKTAIEVKESNIFGTLDKYNKNINYIDSELSKDSYQDLNREDYLSTIKGYHRDKLKLHKEELEDLYKKKEEYSSLVNVITILKDEIQKRRINSERELLSFESRLYEVNLVGVNEDEIKELDKLITSVKSEILENSNLEYEYINDINNYREHVRELDNKIAELEKFINHFEEKVNDIMINSPRDGFTDNKKLLNDKLLLIEYNDRLKSITNQQQYLYVDSKVIKDEIINLWSIKEDDTYESSYAEENAIVDEDSNYEEILNEDDKEDANDILIIDDNLNELPEEQPEKKESESEILEIKEEDDDEDYDIFEDTDTSFVEI